MRPRHRGPHLGVLLLASQLIHVGLDNVPPVTLAALGLNTYLYLFPLAPLMKVCVSVDMAFRRGDWRRLLLSPVHHVDDLHLYFNMASLLWKGVRLERRLGSPFFLWVLAVFSALTGVVYLLTEAALTELLDDHSYSLQCAVGFSGVLFGLKVLVNHYFPGATTDLMGVPVSNRYACWAELVLIHVMSPGTSFVGHLSGIVVGLLYTSGPLQTIMNRCADVLLMTCGDLRARTRFSSSGTSGFRSGHHQPTRHDTDRLTEEDQLQRTIRESLNERLRHGAPPSGGAPLSEEEMRQQRLRRFQR